jgi:hypothetical protein
MLPDGYAASRIGRENPPPEPGFGARPSTVTDTHHADDLMDKCIQLCQDCHAVCAQTVRHCLKLGGRHAEPQHITWLLDCAEICQTTSGYLLRGSLLHEPMCGLCAEVCRQCADNCMETAAADQVHKQCAEMCRRCAGSCERMASKVEA